MNSIVSNIFKRIKNCLPSDLRESEFYAIVRQYLIQSFHPQIKRRIFFLHIPKCGGTSLTNAFRRHFISSIRLKDHTSDLDIHALYKAKDLLQIDSRKYNEYLLPYFMAQPNINFIGGHFYWNKIVYDHFKTEWDFITILRDPISRWFSQYFFNRYKNDPHYKIDVDLHTFAFSDLGTEVGSTYVNWLTDSNDQKQWHGEKLVDVAIQNLHKFKLIGCLDNIDSFIDTFQSIYGVRLIIGEKNVNPKTNYQRDRLISEEILERVRQICAPDIRVYEHALSLMTQRKWK